MPWSPPSPSVPTLALFGVLLAQRLAEVALSARNLGVCRATRGAVVEARPEAGTSSRAHEVALYGVHGLFFALPVTEAALRGWPPPLVPMWLGLALLAVAQGVRAWSMRALGVGWRIPPVAFERDPIVTRGPYAHVRHPNHAVVLLEFLVAPLLVGAPIAWLLLNLMHTPFLLARVRREERALDRVGPYAARLGALPRFVPRLRRAPVPLGEK